MQSRSIRLMLFAASVIALGGCCERPICRFQATPARVCPNGTVTIAWDTGSAPARIEPGLDALAANGERTVTVAGTTSFVLTGRRDGVTQTRTALVTVTDGATSVPISRTLPPCDPSPSISVDLAMPEEGSMVRAVSVTNGGRDPVIVAHAGVTDTVRSGQTSTAFAATPLGGPWTFLTTERRLPPNCTASTVILDPNDPPPHLQILIAGACGG